MKVETAALELSEVERAALAALLRDTIAADRYPLSPRIRMLKAMLAKIEAPVPKADPFPAPKPPGERSMALTRKRRRS